MSLDFEPGTTISHFRLEKKLGEGGMGAVYLAEDLTLDRPVAIKFMSRSMLAQQANASVRDTLEKRFIREAKSAAAINHPNITQIYEANFESDDWFIAMELIKGEELWDMVEGGKTFTVQEIVSVLEQACKGLRFAWDNYKIIHRDIKPQNIMLTKDGMVKIVDLGLAKPITTVEEDEELDDMPDLTCAGTPLGTPQYMAPEQATGEKDLDFRADVYALGATVYELCTGQKAFNERTAPLIYMAQLQKKYTPIAELREDIPEALTTLIDNMLEPKPPDRIASYDEVLAALASIGAPEVSTAATTAAFVSPASMSGQMNLAALSQPGVNDYYPNDHLILDRYRILKPIGKSRAGVVYICMDTELGVECAVKSLLPGREFPAEAMPMIRQNLQRLAGLAHPNLAQIRDLRQDDDSGEIFVVMELLKGRNLREYTHHKVTEDGHLDLRTIAPLMARVAKALDSVSTTYDAAHHDVKPESIYLVDDDTEVKLLDFGLTSFTPIGMTQSEMTARPGASLTSPDYMSPELWRNEDPGRPSDQYSLAVVVYEMLTRHLPFWLKDPRTAEDENGKPLPEQQQLERLKERVLEEDPAPIPELSRSANAALARALAKAPDVRYDSCADFIGALGGGAGGKKKLWIPLAAAAALVAIGVFAMSTRKPQEPRPEPPPVVTPADPGNGDAPPAADDDDSQGGGPAPTVVEPPKPPPVDLTLLKESVAKLQADLDQRMAALKDNKHAAELLPPLTELFAAAVAEGIDPKDSYARLQEAQKLCDRIDSQAARRQAEEEQQRLLLAKTRSEAERLQATFAEQRAALAEKPRAKEFLAAADELGAAAKKAMAEEDFKAALAGYQRAVAACQEAEGKVNKLLQAEAEAAKKLALAARAKVKKHDGVDASIDERVAKYNVALALAREALANEQFDFALQQYQKAEQVCQEIAKLIDEKFKIAIGKDFTVAKLGLEFVWVKSLGIWASKYEVTNGEFRKFKPTHDSKKAENFSMNGDRQPACQLSYYDAVGFCEWLNSVARRDQEVPEGFQFRLPSRDEWQAIAKCGKQRLYPWGNAWPPTHGNFGNQEMFPTTWDLEGYADDFPVTCPVEKSGVNEWGIYGVAGNVWEWTSEVRDGKNGVYGAAWTEVNKMTMVIQPKGFNYAAPSEPYDNIGIRVLMAAGKSAPEKK